MRDTAPHYFIFLFATVLLCLSSNLFGQLTDVEIHALKNGDIPTDTSYVYWLPYEKGKRYLLVQASNSKLSHRDELSADFKMRPGTAICAARNGIVISARSDSDKGGLNEENLHDGNYVVIRHNDGSLTKYWHLQKDGVLVKAGETVAKGQVIAKSGNTGYSAFPHLHFQVVDKSGIQILPRFQTKKGVIYLRPGRWYKAVQD